MIFLVEAIEFEVTQMTEFASKLRSFRPGKAFRNIIQKASKVTRVIVNNVARNICRAEVDKGGVCDLGESLSTV